MNAAALALYKTMTRPYYQRNAALFLFAFIVLFGLVESSQLLSYHLSLLYALASNQIFLLVGLAGWGIYLIKTIQFVLVEMRKQENQFLQVMGALPMRRQVLLLLTVQQTLFAPVSIYILLAAGVAVYAGAIVKSVMLVSYWLLICMLGTWALVHRLNHPDSTFAPGWAARLSLPKWRRPLPLIYVTHSLRNLSWSVLFTKVFSLFTIYLVSANMDAAADVRVALITMLVVAMAHSTWIYELRRLEEERLRFLRNFPWSITRRVGRWVVMCALLLVPEMLLWLRAVPHQLSYADWLASYGFGVALMGGYYAFSFRVADREGYVGLVFKAFLLSFVLILFKLGIVLALGAWAYLGLTLQRRYYDSELTFEKEPAEA